MHTTKQTNGHSVCVCLCLCVYAPLSRPLSHLIQAANAEIFKRLKLVSQALEGWRICNSRREFGCDSLFTGRCFRHFGVEHHVQVLFRQYATGPPHSERRQL